MGASAGSGEKARASGLRSIGCLTAGLPQQMRGIVTKIKRSRK